MRWNMVRKLVQDGVSARVFVTPELFATGLSSSAYFNRLRGLNLTIFVPYRPGWEDDLFTSYEQVIHISEGHEVIPIEEFKRVVALIHTP